MAESDSHPIQVLIVDSYAASTALAHLLTKDGSYHFAPTTIGTLAEALQRIAAAPPDVVLLDRDLPDSRG